MIKILSKFVGKSILLCSALVFAVSLYAATPDFKVVTSNGDIQIKRSNSNDWVNLKSGDQLFGDDQIKIGNKGTLALVHANGSTMEQKNSGTYSVKKLASMATAQKSDVTKKFTKYIVSELSSNEDMTSDGDHRKQMKITGSVERAMGKAAGIEAKYPRSSFFIDKKITFSWYKLESAKEYTFIIKDNAGSKVYEKKVNGTEISLNLDESKMKKGEYYNWHVESNGKSSEDFSIYRMTDDEIAQVNKDVSEIVGDMGKDAGAIGKLVLASYYEEKNIVNRAVSSYEDALKASPEVKNYKKIFAQYLSRIGLQNEAKTIMSQQ